MSAFLLPDTLISDSVLEQLREESAAAENDGRLTANQLAIIYREGWFKMFVPKALGGMELSLPEGLRMEEALARVDGSLGWTVTLCSGATMFVGYLDQVAAAEIFKDPAVCFGGSGQPSGVASVVDGGYIINGSWKYATGAPHLSIFTANCIIEKEGTTLMDANGREVVRSFFFERQEVQIIEDWHTMGLKATAGHSFEVKELFVPDSRSFIISGEAATLKHPVYHYPFLPFAEATLAVNTLGMTLHFLDLCSELFEGRRKKHVTDIAAMLDRKLAEDRETVMGLRTIFYNAVECSWAELLVNGITGNEALEEVGSICREMVVACRAVVLELYPYCGMAGADTGTDINRVWRDLFTASQHSLLTYPS
jgi:alkylation response protein AidB-like acyl-CoA dehydrogenase